MEKKTPTMFQSPTIPTISSLYRHHSASPIAVGYIMWLQDIKWEYYQFMSSHKKTIPEARRKTLKRLNYRVYTHQINCPITIYHTGLWSIFPTQMRVKTWVNMWKAGEMLYSCVTIAMTETQERLVFESVCVFSFSTATHSILIPNG